MNLDTSRTQQIFCTVRLDIYKGTEEFDTKLRSATGFIMTVPTSPESKLFLSI